MQVHSPLLDDLRRIPLPRGAIGKAIRAILAALVFGGMFISTSVLYFPAIIAWMIHPYGWLLMPLVGAGSAWLGWRMLAIARRLWKAHRVLMLDQVVVGASLIGMMLLMWWMLATPGALP